MHNSKCLGCGDDSTTLLCYYCHKTTKKNSALWKRATELWHTIGMEYKENCEYCGIWLAENERCCDHIIPKSVAPDKRFDLNNRKMTCKKCNCSSNKRYKFT